MEIKRKKEQQRILAALARAPVAALLGARQVGKTTLARQIAAAWPGAISWFDLEDVDDLARIAEPKLALAPLSGLVVIDEIQRRPDLFPLLRVLADRPALPARFLILGSASPELLRPGAETLAGRIAYVTLEGFSLDEVGLEQADRLWRRGGFPRAFLAASEEASFAWRRDFIRSFLERDIPQLGIRVPAPSLHRFWQMLAHYHAQVWNGAELDLLVFKEGRRLGFEVKRTTAPKLTPALRSAMADLKLDALIVLHAGEHVFPLAPGVEAWPLVRWVENQQGSMTKGAGA